MSIVSRVSDILYQNSLHAEDKGWLTTEAENVALWVFDVEVLRSPRSGCQWFEDLCALRDAL